MTSASSNRTPDVVPLVSDLSKIYSSTQSVMSSAPRWDRLATNFFNQFGHKPDFVARAPGRVNIIGEHIDHQGFSVLPAAIEADILMAVHVKRSTPSTSTSTTSTSSTSSNSQIKFRLANTTPRFHPCEFIADVKDPGSVELVHQGDERWANYFKVAYKGLHPHLPTNLLDSNSPAGLPNSISVLVDGSIPPESSLSSSAAMTVCSSLVVLQAFGAREQVERDEMGTVAIESERLVGVASGGMDQAASIFGVPNHALHISFYPSLKAIPTRLPDSDPSHVWVIANTLVVSDKKVSGPVQYNLRVAELSMAVHALSKSLNLQIPKITSPTLKNLLEIYFSQNQLNHNDEEVKKSLEIYGEEGAKIIEFQKIVEQILPKEEVDREQVEELTGLKGKEFGEVFLTKFPIRATHFSLYKRSVHVLSEALRVLSFKSICSEATNPSKSQNFTIEEGNQTYSKLGDLMNLSQKSLTENYEASCSEIDQVVEIARSNGALGSRFTGAGWGGSTVHLVPSSKLDLVLKSLKENFYQKRWPELSEGGLNDALLVTAPAGGACIYQV